MFLHSFRQTAAATAVALSLIATFVAAQDQEAALKITRRGSEKKQYQRNATAEQLDREAAFNRIHPVVVVVASQETRRRAQLAGYVVTVANPPDERRSNPLLAQ